jgi:hypothetical protein
MFGNWQISRRTMIQGLGAAVSLPLLDVMSKPPTLAAQQNDSPTRLCYLYIPNGVAEGAWQPDKVSDDGRIRKLNRWMKPLEPFRDDVNVFRNYWTPQGNGHIAGTATWLTGGALDRENVDAGGTSVDQIAARHFKGQTLLSSLELSTKGEGIFASNLPRNSISWVDSATPAPRDYEPRVVFDRMFRAGKSGLGSRSVIDLVLEDSRRLKRRVSDNDHRKIDEYLESVRSIERRIEFAQRQQARANDSPSLKQALVRPQLGLPNDHREYVRTLLDMIVLAYWADATRVSTFMMDHGQSNRYFDFIDGVKGTWHALSHWKDFGGKTEDDDGITSWESRDQKREMYNRVTRWHTEQVAYFLGRLRSIEEPGGSLLDHSMIVYGSSLSDGHEHEAKNLPLVLAGGGAIGIKRGRSIGSDRNSSVSNLHLAMLQRIGVEVTKFADSDSPVSLA